MQRSRNIYVSDNKKESNLLILDNTVFQINKVQYSVGVYKYEERTEEQIQYFVREINEIKKNICDLLDENNQCKNKSCYLWGFLEFVKKNKEHSSQFLNHIYQFSDQIHKILDEIDQIENQIQDLYKKSENLNEKDLKIKEQIYQLSVDIQHLIKYIHKISENTQGIDNQIKYFLQKQIEIDKFKQQSSKLEYRIQNMGSKSIPCM